MKINLQKQFKRRFKQVALCGLLGLGSFSAFAQQSTNLGSVKALKDLLANNAKTATARQQSANNLKFSTEQGNLEAQILNVISKKGSESYAGKILNHGWADFQVEFVNGKAKGFVILFDEKKAYEFTTNDAGNVELKEKSFEKTISIDHFNYPAVSNAVIAHSSAGTPGTTGTGEQIPLLQSNTGASTVVYLDFDGETVTNPYWSNGETINAAKSESSASDIQTIFQIVAEDFAPFNLNVTTNRAIYDATPAGRRQLVIFTTTRSVAPNDGGVAYIGSFAFTQDLPCWVFNMNTTAKDYAEVASHEIGHTFGLSHDGRDFPDGTHEEYYTGHANWGPIVGVAYGKAVSQFSKGEYQYASNTEDDLNIIASTSNAFGFKIDDHANTTTSATVLSIVNNSFTKDGLISTPTDKDYFKFTSTGANATINIRGKYSSFSNLNVFAQILNANQQVIFESNSSNTLEGEFVNVNLPAGDYYIVVDGIGEGDASTGYTDYGSLGAYVISGTFVGGCTEPAWIAATAYNGGQKVSYNNRTYTAQWWSQNERPDLNTGSGKPWVDNGACAVSNRLPLATFTAPAKNSVFNAGTTVTLEASAIDPDGTISKVEFLNSSDVVVGTVTTSPYQLALTNLPAGNYVYKVRATDNLGGVSDLATNNFTINAVKPVVTITSPTEGQNFFLYPSENNAVNVAVGFNVGVSNIDSVLFIVAETVYNGPGGVQVRYLKVKSAPFTLSYIPALKANGYTQVTVTAFSKGQASDAVVRSYYAKPLPEVFFVTPVNNSSVARTTTSIPVAVTVNSANIAIDSVVYFVSDFSGVNQYTTVLDSKYVVKTSPFGFNLPVRAGQNYTRITAVAFGDGAKNSKGLSTQVYYNDAPVVTITAPTVGSKFNVGGSVTVSANVTDDAAVSKVEIYSPHIANSTVTLTAAPYTATFSNLLSSGNRGLTTFIVKATDNTGAVTVQTIDVAENRLPVISVTSPVAVNGINPKYLVGGAITVSANVTDQDGTISKVEITRGSTNTGLVTLTAAPFTTTYTNLPAPQPDGSYSFTVKAYDNNGGVSTQLIIVYKVPSTTITTPNTNPATYKTGANIVIGALPYDPDFTSGKIEYFNGTTKLGEVVVNGLLSGAAYNYTWNNVANGTYTITAKTTDNLGESSVSAPVTVIVRTPTANCTAPTWSASTAYNGGQSVQYNGIKYTANWWTSGDRPDLNNGAVGTGKPWTSNGTCTARFGDATSFATGIYPNPSNGEFTIVVEENATAVILNAVGKEVTTLALVKGNNNISLSLATGVYFVNINNQVTKLVIE